MINYSYPIGASYEMLMKYGLKKATGKKWKPSISQTLFLKHEQDKTLHAFFVCYNALH